MSVQTNFRAEDMIGAAKPAPVAAPAPVKPAKKVAAPAPAPVIEEPVAVVEEPVVAAAEEAVVEE